jgi:hypothetical protein
LGYFENEGIEFRECNQNLHSKLKNNMLPVGSIGFIQGGVREIDIDFT